MGFLGGLAGIGSKLIGGLSGGGASPAAAETSGLQRHMGGLSQGLSSLSANLLDTPQPQPELRRKPAIAPAPAKPLPASATMSPFSATPYSGEGVSMGGGFVT